MPESSKAKYVVRFCFVFFVLVLCLVGQFSLVLTQRSVDHRIATDMGERQHCMMLIDEFRLVDQRLTRFARAYCATEDEDDFFDYEHLYEWSAGKLPRPPGQNLQITGGIEGETISQIDILRRLNVHDATLLHFQRAIECSDALAAREEQAMKSVSQKRIIEGPEKSEEGETPEVFAKRILYNEAYQTKVDEIADHLETFTRIYSQHMAQKIEDLRLLLDRFYWVTFVTQILTIGLITLLLARLFQIVRREEKTMLVELDDREVKIGKMEYGMLMLEKELEVAGQIQQEFLPPPFDICNSTTIWGKMIPAKATGGDLYDYYWIDPQRLGFAIGDVSGKGMSAAMFMSRTLTLFRAGISAMNGQIGYDLSGLIQWINKQLADRNEQNMFVTFFAGILDKINGQFRYCNAGHPFAILIHREGTVEIIATEPDLILGIDADFPYKEHSVPIQQGDTIILYTDGVTEAISTQGDLYGEQRLRQLLSSSEVQNKTPEEIANLIIEHTHQFANGAVQSDDITTLVLKNV